MLPNMGENWKRVRVYRGWNHLSSCKNGDQRPSTAVLLRCRPLTVLITFFQSAYYYIGLYLVSLISSQLKF